MWSTKEIIIFCAGAEAFHTLTHIVFYSMVRFPMQLPSFTFTQKLNVLSIFINGIITAWLLWWANTL